MKGIILAGGCGTRLQPLTNYINKHMALVYNKPMICYPIDTLVNAGITDVAVIVSGPFSGQIITFIKDGKHLGLEKVTYLFQENPTGGIADALSLAREFAGYNDVCVVLGDNTTDFEIKESVNNYIKYKTKIPSAFLFLKRVPDPRAYGVAKLNSDNEIVEIIEKPKEIISDLAVTGLYIYDHHVFDFIARCKPSGRGQLEITDVNNFYLKEGNVYWEELKGFWKDAGDFESLYHANKYWAEYKHLLKNEPR